MVVNHFCFCFLVFLFYYFCLQFFNFFHFFHLFYLFHFFNFFYFLFRINRPWFFICFQLDRMAASKTIWIFFQFVFNECSRNKVLILRNFWTQKQKFSKPPIFKQFFRRRQCQKLQDFTKRANREPPINYENWVLSWNNWISGRSCQDAVRIWDGLVQPIFSHRGKIEIHHQSCRHRRKMSFA